MADDECSVVVRRVVDDRHQGPHDVDEQADWVEDQPRGE